MSEPTEDNLRTGFGLKRLRDRFVRRAEFLTTEGSFLEALSSARMRWNERFPGYLIGPSGSGRDEPPAKLMTDFQRYRDTLPPAEKPWWLVPWEEVKVKPNEPWSEAAEGIYEWERMIAEIGYTFWPQIDFADPVPYSAHPARVFITVGLYPVDQTDRWRKVDDYFPAFEWKPEPVRWHRGESELWPEMTNKDQMDWYLPLYPGLTVNDLKIAAPAIARKLDEVYKHRTLDKRVRALREEGKSQQAIADRLGTSRKNVSKILRST